MKKLATLLGLVTIGFLSNVDASSLDSVSEFAQVMLIHCSQPRDNQGPLALEIYGQPTEGSATNLATLQLLPSSNGTNKVLISGGQITAGTINGDITISQILKVGTLTIKGNQGTLELSLHQYIFDSCHH